MSDYEVNGHLAPPPLGPYTPVVKAGNLIFVSAQAGVDPDTREVPAGGFEMECRQAFSNLVSAVRAGGSEPRDVVKTTILYVDITDLPIINAIFAETFPDSPPARTAAIVQLAGGRRFAIDAIAVTAN